MKRLTNALSSILLAALFFAASAAAQERVAPRASVGVAVTPAQAQAAAGTKEVVVFGQKIQYVEAGSGPVVVLLHGMGGNHTNWAFTTPVLAGRFRVIVPDQLGHGRSDKPLINYRIGTYVDFLDKFLSELKVERAALVGNSMGGWIAAAYALKHPAKVERLVLVGAAGFRPPKEFDLSTLSGLNPSTREGMRQLAQLVFFNKMMSSDAAVDALLTARLSAGDGYTIQALVESIHRGEDMLDGRLSAVKQPTLLVWGRNDGLTPLAREGEKFKQEMPHAQLVVFEECGHVPQVEKPADFNAAVLKFLTQS